MMVHDYRALWAALSQPMLVMMNTLYGTLLQDPAGFSARFRFCEPLLADDGKESSVCFILEDVSGVQQPRVLVRFKLYDGYYGANIGVKVYDLLANEETWGYTPYDMTPDCFTADHTELQRRVKDFPLETLVGFMRAYLEQLPDPVLSA